MAKTEIREKVKAIIREAFSVVYYKVSDDMSEHDLTEEAEEGIKAMNHICEQLCKCMGREHYTM